MQLQLTDLIYSIRNDTIDFFIYKIHKNISLIDSTDQFGNSLLHHCAYNGEYEKLEVLINMGATIVENNNKESLLHYAVAKCKDDFLVVNLVKMGFSPIKRNKEGVTPIHLGGSEKIAAFFNNWLTMKQFPINTLIDNKSNNVTHISYRQGNSLATTYWSKVDSTLETINSNGETWWNQKNTNKIISLD